MSAADTLARAYEGMDKAAMVLSVEPAAPIIPILTTRGWTVFGIAGTIMRTTLPTLREDAPHEIRHRYWMRVVADCTGTCPACSEVVTLTVDPERTPAAWEMLPVTLAIPHPDDCTALFGEADREWFDPEAFE